MNIRKSKNDNNWKIENSFEEGILNWYTFNRGDKILQISSKETQVSEYLNRVSDKFKRMAVDELIQDKNLPDGEFDYIIVIGELEYIDDIKTLLAIMMKKISDKGKLLLGFNNRLGIKYFCGERDPFTHHVFDGVENYRNITEFDKKFIKGRCYSKSELNHILDSVEGINYKYYSVMPSLKFPQLIIADVYNPNEEFGIRYFPKYTHPESVFLEEEYLYTDLIENNIFHSMANAFLIECTTTGTLDNTLQVTLSMDRGHDKSFATIIRSNARVEKKGLYNESRHNLIKLDENMKDIEKHGLSVVDGHMIDGIYTMEYFDKPLANVYLANLANKNTEKFILEIDSFVEEILKSSDCVGERSANPYDLVLKRGYIDLVPLNCFYNNGEFVFFDQEFYIENLPAKVIIFRMLEVIYLTDKKIEQSITKEYFIEKYGLKEEIDTLKQLTWEFTYKLRNQKELMQFNEKHKAIKESIYSNRKKINYSDVEYKRIFKDIFFNIEEKNIIIFGSGRYAQRFIELYKQQFNIVKIIDNNLEKQGSDLQGIEIISPKEFKHYSDPKYRIIICVKNYLSIIKQLHNLDCVEYYVYDPNINYDRTRSVSVQADQVKKKYNVGYISGVFDLFHVGHLNLLRRSKEMCNYLIVGVVTDEGVRNLKKVEPYVPCNERCEIVKNCRYVDEVHKIPVLLHGSKEALKMYSFDCQFSGSDYEFDKNWLREKEYLNKRGVDMVFLPYTQHTSSSKLKKALDDRRKNGKKERDE